MIYTNNCFLLHTMNRDYTAFAIILFSVCVNIYTVNMLFNSYDVTKSCGDDVTIGRFDGESYEAIVTSYDVIEDSKMSKTKSKGPSCEEMDGMREEAETLVEENKKGKHF